MILPGTIDLPARPGAPVRPRLLAVHVVVWLALCSPLLAQSQESPATSGGFWSAVTSTMPFGAQGQGTPTKGWWQGNLDGAKRIGADGGTDLFISGWAWHTPWHYSEELRDTENEAAWGGGFGRTLTDLRGQRRTFYATFIRDSHWNFQYTLGYAWLARTPPAVGFRLGVGYSAFLIGREEYNYVPVPLALPAASAGWDAAEVLITYIPGHEVIYFFGRISLPQRGPRD